MKNMNDIRQMLAEEIQKLRDKQTTPANVNAIVNATGKILSTIKMEIDYAKLTNKHAKIDFIQLSDVEITPAATATLKQ